MKGEFSYQTATTLSTRLKGLLGQTEFEPLLIPNCRAVHTFGMKVPLDLVWLDDRDQLVRLDKNVSPNRIKACFAASGVLECEAGTGENVMLGLPIAWEPRSFTRDESGQALVETAFVLPVLIILVFGFIQLGLALSEQQKLIYTANYATQVGSITNDNLRVTGAVEEFYSVDEVAVAIENFDGETGGALAPTDRYYQDVITVQLTKPFALQIPFVSITVLDLQAESSARILCNASSLNPTCT